MRRGRVTLPDGRVHDITLAHAPAAGRAESGAGLHWLPPVEGSGELVAGDAQIQTALQHAWAARSHALLYKLKARDLERIPLELRLLMVNQSDLLYVIDQMVRIMDTAISRHLRGAQ